MSPPLESGASSPPAGALFASNPADTAAVPANASAPPSVERSPSSENVSMQEDQEGESEAGEDFADGATTEAMSEADGRDDDTERRSSITRDDDDRMTTATPSLVGGEAEDEHVGHLMDDLSPAPAVPLELAKMEDDDEGSGGLSLPPPAKKRRGATKVVVPKAKAPRDVGEVTIILGPNRPRRTAAMAGASLSASNPASLAFQQAANENEHPHSLDIFDEPSTSISAASGSKAGGGGASPSADQTPSAAAVLGEDLRRLRAASTPTAAGRSATAASSPAAANGRRRSTAPRASATAAAAAVTASIAAASAPVASSAVSSSDGRSTRGGGDTKGKGKGKASLPPVERADHEPNNDYCTSCNGIGRFLCCDGCPRSFHFACLEPPLDIDDVPDDQWFCTECRVERAQTQIPLPQPPPTLFGLLIQKIQFSNPVQFQLPEEIRNYYAGVQTSPGGSYVDANSFRAMRTDRKGYVEERDPYRLKDSKGNAILCYKCHGTAAPIEGAGELRPIRNAGRLAVELAPWRKVMSCDYCSLHWHFDCLDPPLYSLPGASKKWMCPNHVDHVLPNVRVPKRGNYTVTVRGRREPNNGNVEIIPLDAHSGRNKGSSSVECGEVIINAKRFRVPEKTIRLDFWDKILEKARRAGEAKTATAKAMGRGGTGRGGSLSSLTSIDESRSSSPSTSRSSTPTPEAASVSKSGSPELSKALLEAATAVEVATEGDDALSYLALLVDTALGHHPVPQTSSSDLPAIIDVVLPPLPPPPPLPAVLSPSSSSPPVPSAIPSKVNGHIAPSPLSCSIATAPDDHQPSLSSPARTATTIPKITLHVGGVDRPAHVQLTAAASSSGNGIEPTTQPPPSSSSEDVEMPVASNTKQAANGDDAAPIMPEELAQLRAVRELLHVKGKEELLAFLRS